MYLPSHGKRRTFISGALVGAVLLIGALASAYVYYSVDLSGRTHIIDRANTVAQAVPRADFAALSGDANDEGTPEYERLKALLSGIRAVNADVRFVYLLGERDDGTLFFYADSEDPTSEDYSAPGDIYYEATPAMQAFFKDGQSIVEGPDRDRWGLWISGYAPLYRADGTVAALVGIDLPATAFITDLAIYTALPFLLALLIAILVASVERTRREREDALSEREEFLSIASHEIRTPLTGIRWALESIMKDPASVSPEARTLLPLMHENAVGLINRINNLLDVSALSRREGAPLQRETLDIDGLFDEIFASLALAAKERSVTLQGPASAGAALRVDRQIMHQALFNLVANAVKYTRAGSVVKVSYEKTGDGDQIRIRDQGPGIPEAEQGRIFEGYHRTDAAKRSKATGTGLGLYLTKKAIELHDGTIRVESAPGRGTTFIVTLPS